MLRGHPTCLSGKCWVEKWLCDDSVHLPLKYSFYPRPKSGHKKHSDFPYASVPGTRSAFACCGGSCSDCQSRMSLAFKDLSRDKSNINIKWSNFRVQKKPSREHVPASSIYRQWHEGIESDVTCPRCSPVLVDKECGPSQVSGWKTVCN